MRRMACLGLFAALLLAPVAAQETLNTDIIAKIRQEENSHSQIMRTLHFLSDVYGPRMTGSPNLKAAGEWAIKTMEGWGFTNGHLEPWDFGHPGWVNERFSAHIISPVKDQLTAEVLAWTPSTSGTVTAQATQIVLPERPTREELAAALASQKDKVNGRIVLVGKAAFVPVNINPPPKRRADDQVRAQYDPNNPNAGRGGRGGRGADQGPPPPMSANEVNRQVDEFLVANGAKLRVNDAAREHGQIIAFSNRTYDLAKAVPTVVMRNEDYGRISRILADGTPVELEFNIVNKVYPDGRTAYNTIAEIPVHRQEGRSRDAGRPPRFVAFRDRSDRQRRRLCDDDGGGAHSEGDRRRAAPHHSRRALEWGGRRHPRLAGVREGAFRHVRKPEAGVREAGGVPEHRFGHGPRARRRRVRTAVGCCRRAPRARAISGSRG